MVINPTVGILVILLSFLLGIVTFLSPLFKSFHPAISVILNGVVAIIYLTLLLHYIVRLVKLVKLNALFFAIAKNYDIEEAVLGRGPQVFTYNALSGATKDFNATEVLGSGAFGSVYKGSLVLSKGQSPTLIAVKRMFTTFTQGPEEFLAEVRVVGQTQHRNLVKLLGWCHERDDLMLVYEYMPNGSIHDHLYKKSPTGESSTLESVLTWARRLKILSGVATALAYLHEEWEQRVIHRDVKSSNVMLDGDFNARLGDFGLARLYEHDQATERKTGIAGTYGYLAPELPQTLKPTEKTDVYSFGTLVLEVATGKRPLLRRDERPEGFDGIFLVDWVWDLHRDDALLRAADCTLEDGYDAGEMEMVLNIGLLCSHPNPDERPNTRDAISIWKGSSPVPPLPREKPVPIFPVCSSSLPGRTGGSPGLQLMTSSIEEPDCQLGHLSLAEEPVRDCVIRVLFEHDADSPTSTVDGHEGREGVLPQSLRYRSQTPRALPF